jgi:hypothetical protein
MLFWLTYVMNPPNFARAFKHLRRDLAIYAIPRLYSRINRARRFDTSALDVVLQTRGRTVTVRWLRLTGLIRFHHLTRKMGLVDALEHASRCGDLSFITELAHCGYTLEVIRAQNGLALASARNIHTVRRLITVFGANVHDFVYGLRRSQQLDSELYITDLKQITLLISRVFGLNMVWHLVRPLLRLDPV